MKKTQVSRESSHEGKDVNVKDWTHYAKTTSFFARHDPFATHDSSTSEIKSPVSPPVSLSKSVRASDALHGRLDKILVLELQENGERKYMSLTVRGIYKYVLAAITKPAKNVDQEGENQHASKDFKLGQEEEEGGWMEGKRTRQVSLSRKLGRRSSMAGTDTGQGCQVTYRERLGAYLHPRDMRRLVSDFSSSNEPEIIVRRHVVLLDYVPFRAIVLRDRILIIVPEGSYGTMSTLERRIMKRDEENVFFGDDGADSESCTSVDTGFFGLNNMKIFGKTVIKQMKTNLVEKPQEIAKDTINIAKDTINIAKDTINAIKPFAAKLSPFVTTRSSDSIMENAARSADNEDKNDSDKDSNDGSDGSHESLEHVTTDDDSFEMDNKSCKSISATVATTNAPSVEDELLNEWNELRGKEWIELPFALHCVDSVLHVMAATLYDDTYKLQELMFNRVGGLLEGTDRFSGDPLLVIRHIKDSIGEMKTRMKSFMNSLNHLLENDEEMALMNLERLITHPENFIKPVTEEELQEETDEPELVLEAHLQSAITVMNCLNLMQGKIGTASDLVNQKLDSIQNRILFTNMIISVMSLCVGTATFVPSMLGMNLSNSIEQSEYAFRITAVTTIVGSFLLMLLILGILEWSGITPKSGLSGTQK